MFPHSSRVSSAYAAADLLPTDSPLRMPGAFPSPAVPSGGTNAAVAGRARTFDFMEVDDTTQGQADEDEDMEFLARGLRTVRISAN